ncbi:phage tail length tape measure family protein [Rhizobium sp. NLR22b]|uniref:phage tail length tape measure family protein n=1 Tax=Rhizobium sp. NLR22b TaxID=2731115 RepID=UPI001C839D5D|nr:phage tail length tape measure family protein [Rhizobium sp. NLR22b]MBX5238620.1 hypothetical protein [Rhizobium sp. NLR22b]
MDRGVSIYIDPTGAQTGGRVVKRELQEIGQAAVQTQRLTDQLAKSQMEAAKSAQASAQVMFQQLDTLRAKYNPVFAVIQRYKSAQDEIRQAHRLGAISTNEMAAALSRERQASLSAMQAIKGHTTSVIADNAALRAASFQRRNLIFQLNDIAVSLASGMNPLMVAAQQGSQIGQIYMGQGGVVTALRETADMAGNLAVRFGRIGVAATIAGAAAAAGLSHIRDEAQKALGSTVTWGETLTATFQTIWDSLKSVFGPAVSTLLDPLFYAFDKLSSAAVDIAEMLINVFRACGYDIALVFDQLPNIIGAAFVGGVNAAIEELNSLVKSTSDSVDQIIAAFNKIPGIKIPSINAPSQTIAPRDNTYAKELEQVAKDRDEAIKRIMSDTPIRDFGGAIADRIGTNRAQSRLSDLANLDFSKSIQSATGLGTAVTGIATAAKQASSTVVDVNQQMMDARRQSLIGFEQQGDQLRTMKTELKDIQATLASAAKTPVSDVFGRDIGDASGAIEAAASSIQKVFTALDGGQITAQTAHESLELVRASLKAMGGDSKAVDAWVNAIINGSIRVRELDSNIKTLSQSIMGIPNRVIQIGIQQYTVPSSGGGTKGVNVYGGNADFSYQQYNVGGKTIGVSGGNGSYGLQHGLIDAADYQAMYETLGYGGARAAGGPTDAGKTYLVGEKGPELLTMGGAGNVTNADSTASILSGGRDTLSLIEDHDFNTLQELRIHTNYFETYESDFTEMLACLKAVESGIASAVTAARSTASVSYGSSGGGSSRGGGGFGSGYGSGGTGGSPNYNSIYSGIGITYTNGTGAIGYGTYNISPGVIGYQKNPGLHGFATGGQIMPGEDQKVEFFKKNTERVIVVDDKKVSDSRSGGQAAEKPTIHAPMNFHFNGNLGDQKSRQAMADDIRRTVLQVLQSR